MSKKLRLIDIETGQDLTEEYRIRSVKQDEAYVKVKQAEEYKNRNVGRRWVACYHDSIKGLSEMKLHELGALIKLLPYMQFKKDGLLIKEAEPMSVTEIMKVLKKKKTATQDILNALLEYNVLEKIKVGRKISYRVNEAYHTIGEVIGESKFTKLYQVETRKTLDNLTINEAGLLYKILPYFHFENYYLCANPDEPEPSEIRHLNHDQLSLLIDEDVKTVYNNMVGLIRQGIVMKLSAFGAVNYLVNPDIMFRKESEDAYTDKIRKQFKELDRTASEHLQ